MPQYMEGPDGTYYEFEDDWTADEMNAYFRKEVQEPAEFRQEREKARAAEIAAKDESELEKDRATVANIERLSQVDIPGYEDMSLDEKVAARQELMWNELNPAHKFAIGFTRLNKEVGNAVDSIFGEEDARDEDVRRRKVAAENELWDMIDGFDEAGAEDLGYYVNLASMAGGAGGVGVKALGWFVNSGTRLASAAWNGMARVIGPRTQESVAKHGIENVNAAARSLGSKVSKAQQQRIRRAKNDKELEQALLQNMDEVSARASMLQRSKDIRILNPKTAQQAARTRISKQKEATKGLIKDTKEAAARREAHRLRRAKEKHALERTLGIRGQAKQWQKAQTKEAIKRSPGGY